MLGNDGITVEVKVPRKEPAGEVVMLGTPVLSEGELDGFLPFFCVAVRRGAIV